ncbi:MarR family transcriptional regulator [Saccharopolyspora erythraea]|uniref:MarR family winged helix-turn-helix transcriptional regulator n=1 Tax=Saccharopolyspora erythraea TaxID=1836 RepID=UPI001BADD3A3|nr:MarR family transcriptional regulator [Saccharopolyspora erythraea]QUH02422.1 MarR family transcriptional regulator [Saccharopolyspora erythraea]
MHDTGRLGNLLGAAALAVSDRLLAGATAAAGTSASGAAALVVLADAAGLSVTELGRRVGLSQSAAARMVDALEKQGLVRREATWGKAVAVRLTDAGRETADGLLGARGGALGEVVGALDRAEREQLEQLLAKLLTGLYRRSGDAERLCRLCDRGSCVARGAVCPVGRADREHRAREGFGDG